MPIGKLSPVLTQTSIDSIRIVAEFPHIRPKTVFEYWTNPELLQKWWPPQAELKAEGNGGYHFSWPNQNWHLRGRFTEVVKDERLGFTWKWDHETIEQTRVKLTFDSMAPDGTRLTLQHTGYSDDAGAKKIRDEHVEGWMYFLGKLQEQFEASSGI